MPRSRIGRWGSFACALLLFGLACAELQVVIRIARELRGTPRELGSLMVPASALALAGSATLEQALDRMQAPDVNRPSEAPEHRALTTPSPWRSNGATPPAPRETPSQQTAVADAPRVGSLSGLLRGVRVVPEQRDGKMVGLRLLGVKPDGVLGQIGLKNGDRLDTINGYRVTEPSEVLTLYSRLRQLDRLSIAIERDGRTVTITINIV